MYCAAKVAFFGNEFAHVLVKHSGCNRNTSVMLTVIGLSTYTGKRGTSGPFQPTQGIHDFLGAFQRKAWNDNLAAALGRIADDLRGPRVHRVYRVVVAVAVGAFHHDHVEFAGLPRIAKNRHMHAAKIAAFQKTARRPISPAHHLDHCRTQDVSRVMERDRNTGKYFARVLVVERLEELHGS